MYSISRCVREVEVLFTTVYKRSSGKEEQEHKKKKKLTKRRVFHPGHVCARPGLQSYGRGLQDPRG